jgi:hypothetical protein
MGNKAIPYFQQKKVLKVVAGQMSYCTYQDFLFSVMTYR